MNEHLRTKINEAISKMCGWHPINDNLKGWTNGKEMRWPSPDYCQNRNALPEIKNPIIQAGKWEEYSHYLRHLCEDINPGEYGLSRTLAVSFAEPLLVCIATLKALALWTPDMEALWQEEQKSC